MIRSKVGLLSLMEPKRRRMPKAGQVSGITMSESSMLQGMPARLALHRALRRRRDSWYLVLVGLTPVAPNTVCAGKWAG